MSVTPSNEDYLKAIYSFSEELGRSEASTGDIAEALGISHPAVSKMLKQLEKQSLVQHTPYHGVRLTGSGRLAALKTIRRHRLLELYLVKALGYSIESVHAEAEQLEHHISDKFEQRIYDVLNKPKYCPHGSPIPSIKGRIAPLLGISLSDVNPPADLNIARLRIFDSKLLEYLEQSGLLPGTNIKLVERPRFGGDLKISIKGRRLALSLQAAKGIFVIPRSEV